VSVYNVLGGGDFLELAIEEAGKVIPRTRFISGG
jgi:hypothetical protein